MAKENTWEPRKNLGNMDGMTRDLIKNIGNNWKGIGKNRKKRKRKNQKGSTKKRKKKKLRKKE